jgi:phosphatidate cytidylyltransferase
MFTSDFFFLYILIVFSVFSIIEFFNINKKITKNNAIQLSFNILFIIFVSIISALFFLFSSTIQLKIILFILLLGCIASDIGGYIIGKIFKGPKLTSISPNKTFSGSLGSLIFSMIIINTLIYYYVEIINIKIFLLAALTSLGCQLGDLFFSFLKRKANLKDTGNLLPGHGGVLDRLDGILFGLPVGFISFILIY